MGREGKRKAGERKEEERREGDLSFVEVKMF